MTANPLTDQILAAFTEIERDNPPPAASRALLDDFAATITRVLPDVDQAVIGEVLMHAGAIFNTIGEDAPYLDQAATFGANVLIGSGGRLYTTKATS